jgi:TrmH family RNA methyltransferase
MPVRVVESKDNARLKELRKALAAAGRSAQGRVGLVGIEGPHLLEEALRAGLRVTTIFVAQDAERLLDALRVPPEIEILRLPAKLLHSALATEAPQPIAALVEPPEWSWAHVLGTRQSGAATVVVLAGREIWARFCDLLRPLALPAW